jgi:DNA-directed RNA polymerase subunit RPC12/RpoP
MSKKYADVNFGNKLQPTCRHCGKKYHLLTAVDNSPDNIVRCPHCKKKVGQ